MASISKNQQITPRQLEVLAAISRFEGRQCYSPTIAELASELNVSRTTVFEHVAGLRGKKLVTDSKGRARSSRLTAKARRLLEEYESSADVLAVGDNFGGIALLGKVAAGSPIEAVEDRQSLSLGDMFGTSDDVFALEVSGDSMIEEGIDSGDYVICKRSQSAGSGQIVVAIMEEEVTLKRFYREKDRVRLEPANEAYDPIYSDNCKIEAVVIGLLHRY